MKKQNFLLYPILLLGVFSVFASSCEKEIMPVVTTTAVSNIIDTTATSGGDITDEGSSTVISRGVCWSTGTTPTISDNKTADGAGAGSYSSKITGLNGATVYYVRAYASNSEGTGYGMALAFTTLGQEPVATTQTAINITGTSATLVGSVNPNYLSTEVTFEYGTTTSYGSTTIPSQSPITGNTVTNVSSDITGLIAGTTYHYRVKVVNQSGSAYSDNLTFTTFGQTPMVTTTAVSNIIDTTATSGGDITDEGSSTVISRGVCWSTGTTPTISDNKTSDGAGAGSYSSKITGLNGATVYYVRAYASNSEGTGYGMALAFTTLGQEPVATTQTAINITGTSAILKGTVNANYLNTIVTFEYGTTTSYGNTITATQSPLTGNANISVSANTEGLIPITKYHFRIKAENEMGTTFGDDMTFTTLGQVPTVVTSAAMNISTTGAILKGTVNANYLNTIVTFEYGTTTSYGNTIIGTQSPVTGNTNMSVSAEILELNFGTTYHFRVKAENELGTIYGDNMTFITLGLAPYISTIAVSNISSTSATLVGSVNPNYLSTEVTFEYGTTTSYGSTTIPSQSPITGNTVTNVSSDIMGLIVGTLYHFRIKAENALGTTYSNDLIFTTAPPPINDIDGNTYNVIRIGTQVWMAENLKSTKYNDGSNIPLETDNATWASLTTPAYCWYSNDKSIYGDTYGALYNWYTVETGNLCPAGWHVPTDEDWKTMEIHLGMSSTQADRGGYRGTDEGGKLKETGTTHWSSPNTGATNESGFTALPGGRRYSNGPFGSSIGSEGNWWSKSINHDFYVWYRYMEYNYSKVGRSSTTKEVGFSVRCVRD